MRRFNITKFVLKRNEVRTKLKQVFNKLPEVYGQQISDGLKRLDGQLMSQERINKYIEDDWCEMGVTFKGDGKSFLKDLEETALNEVGAKKDRYTYLNLYGDNDHLKQYSLGHYFTITYYHSVNPKKVIIKPRSEYIKQHFKFETDLKDMVTEI